MNSEDVFKLVVTTLSERGSEGEIRTSELVSLLRENFDASDSQISGLIYRMRTSKGILKKIGRGIYVLDTNESIVSDILYETDTLIKRVTSKLQSGFISMSPSELIGVQTFLKELEVLKDALQDNDNTKTEEEL